MKRGRTAARFQGLAFPTFLPAISLTSTIWGSIIRFSKSGRICSEEILESSGIFMLVWLIIQYVALVPVLFVGGGVLYMAK